MMQVLISAILSHVPVGVNALYSVSNYNIKENTIMATGTVKFFNESKGFGFITPEGGGKDLFVHVSEIDGGMLYEDDNVEFDIGEGQKGPCAVSVRKV